MKQIMKTKHSSIIRRLYFLSFACIMFSVNMLADTKQCPKCHGSGWQVTIPDVGHYGVERHKQKCPVCGDMVFSGHRDKCTMCGGSGGVDDGRRSSRRDDADSRAAEGEVVLCSTPDARGESDEVSSNTVTF